jgi:hypothetical protein
MRLAIFVAASYLFMTGALRMTLTDYKVPSAPSAMSGVDKVVEVNCNMTVNTKEGSIHFTTPQVSSS